MLPEYNTLISHFGNQKHSLVLRILDGCLDHVKTIASVFIINCMIILPKEFIYN